MPIVLITLLGAVLRLIGMGHQGFWYDESYTVELVRYGPGRMLGQLPHVESTPPLYYCVAWVWARIFGFGPAGLKSLSAVCGTLTIPVAYAATQELLRNRRAALIVAALTAFNPFLIWYSQEARAYSMLVLLSACSLWAFACARERPQPRALALWGLASALALLTHYYAVILIVPEAVWLLYLHRRSRSVQVAIAGVGLVGVALLPLLLAQDGTHNDSWIAQSSYLRRLAQLLPMAVLGPETHLRALLKLLGFAAIALGIGLLIWRSRSEERRDALLPGGIALAGLILSAGPGHNTLLARNLLPVWLPALIFLGAGLGVARARAAGLAATVVLCAIGLTAAVSVATTYAFQRPNWQLLADLLGPWPQHRTAARDARIVMIQDNPGGMPLGLYFNNLRYIKTASVHDVSAIDVIAVADTHTHESFCWWGSACNLVPSRLDRDYSIPGFHIVARRRVRQFRVLELRSAHPTTVRRTSLPTATHNERRHFVPSGHAQLNDAQLVQQG